MQQSRPHTRPSRSCTDGPTRIRAARTGNPATGGCLRRGAWSRRAVWATARAPHGARVRPSPLATVRARWTLSERTWRLRPLGCPLAYLPPDRCAGRVARDARAACTAVACVRQAGLLDPVGLCVASATAAAAERSASMLRGALSSIGKRAAQLPDAVPPHATPVTHGNTHPDVRLTRTQVQSRPTTATHAANTREHAPRRAPDTHPDVRLTRTQTYA